MGSWDRQESALEVPWKYLQYGSVYNMEVPCDLDVTDLHGWDQHESIMGYHRGKNGSP